MQFTNTYNIRNLKTINSSYKLKVVTSYDAAFTHWVDGEVDIILVGDSLGMVIQGCEDTLSVTLDHMIYHSRAVSRKAQTSHLVVDMPVFSYGTNLDKTISSVRRLVQEGRAQSVKLEGCTQQIIKEIETLTQIGIPVMGHIGLTPQHLHNLGGFKVQGKTQKQADMLMEQAQQIEKAGAYAIVLEAMPASVGKQITDSLTIPTIGIGAGPDCNGQVLVLHDLLGLTPGTPPKFVKQYEQMGSSIKKALKTYADEVDQRTFPAPEHGYNI